MFRSILSKSLRDYRWAILGWGIGLGILPYAQYATFGSMIGSTSPAQLQQLVSQFLFFGEGVRVDTPGGFVTFKVVGLLPVILGIWTLLAGARMTRGEEESGTLDITLSTPQPRGRLLGQKVLALAAATGLICVIVALWMLAGMASANVTVDLAAALLASANVGLGAFVFGALALLLAQFLSRSAAAGWAGGLMAVAYVLDGTGRTMSGAASLRRITPFYYYDQNLPLVPGYTPNWGALAVLVALCLVLVGAAAPLFVRRDVGRSVLADVTWSRRAVVRHKTAQQVIAAAEREVWVRGIGVQALRRQGATILWWVVALAVLAGYLVIVAKTAEKQIADLIGNSPLLQQIFGGTNLGTNAGFLAAIVFGYVPITVTIFASIIAYRWAVDIASGRLELLLAAPLPRWRLVLERYGAVAVAALAAAAGVWLAVLIFAQASGFAVDAGHVAAASFGMLPLELVAAALVFALAGLIPPGAVIGIFSLFLGVSYLTDLLKTLLKLPDWVVNVSIFHQYGNPMKDGIAWGPVLGMLAVAMVLLGIGVAQFSLRDIDRGDVES